MRQLLFGKLDPAAKRRAAERLFKGIHQRGTIKGYAQHDNNPKTGEPFDTVNGTTLLTPEWDKGNDDRDAIRSSLRLDEHKSASVIE